jgi:hypothetical protein
MLNKKERERKEHKKHIKYYNENNFTVYTCDPRGGPITFLFHFNCMCSTLQTQMRVELHSACHHSTQPYPLQGESNNYSFGLQNPWIRAGKLVIIEFAITILRSEHCESNVRPLAGVQEWTRAISRPRWQWPRESFIRQMEPDRFVSGTSYPWPQSPPSWPPSLPGRAH